MSKLTYFYSRERDKGLLITSEFFPAREDRDNRRESLCKRLAHALKRHSKKPRIIHNLTMERHINSSWPNFIIPTPSAFQGGTLLAKLVNTVCNENKINIIFVQPEDLIHVREGNLNLCYVTYGAVVSKDCNIVHGDFKEGLLADKVSHCTKDEYAKDKLYRSGICLLNDSAISETCRRKDLTQIFLEKLGVTVPCCLSIQNTDNLEEKLKNFLNSSTETNDIVIKPSRGSKGCGIKFFNKNNLAEIQEYVQQLLDQGQSVVIQERINPLLLLNDSGKRLDWNLRVISFGSEKPVICNIRSDEYEKFAPVNKSLGSKTEVFSEELFIEYSEDSQKASQQYQTIISNIERLLQTVDPELRSSGLIGYDIIIKQDLSAVVIELNGDATGGIGTALEYLNDRPDCQRVLASKIIESLHKNLRKSELSRKNTCPTNKRIALHLV